MKHSHYILIFLAAALIAGLSGCVSKQNPETNAEPPAIPSPTQYQAGEIPSARLGKKPHKDIKKLGDQFCAASRKSDFAAMTDMFHSKFLLSSNPNLMDPENPDIAEALPEMERRMRDAMLKDMKKSRTNAVTACEVVSAMEDECSVAAALSVDKIGGEITSYSMLAAMKKYGITICGFLQVRETTNVNIEYARFLVGGDDKGNWSLLLGLTQ